MVTEAPRILLLEQRGHVLSPVRRALEDAFGDRVELCLDDDLPEVYCDPDEIGRVIVNLAIAVVELSLGEGSIKVWARSGYDTSEVTIGVIDICIVNARLLGGFCRGTGLRPRSLAMQGSIGSDETIDWLTSAR